MSAASACEKGGTSMEIRTANPMPASPAETIVIAYSEEAIHKAAFWEGSV